MPSADGESSWIGGHHQQWIEACKTGKPTDCNFDYAGQMIEQMLLGLVAYKAGTRIEYDAAAGRVTNNEKANEYLRREYREGWKLNG